MESVNALLMQMLNEDKKAREDARAQASKDNLAKLEAAKEKRKEKASSTPRGLISGIQEGALSASGLGFIGAWGDRVVGALFGGASLAVITGAIGSMIGKGLVFGGLAALVGSFGDDLIRSLFNQVAPGVDPETAARISESISSNASTGLMAAMIPGVGVKGGVGVTLGGIIGDGINAYLGEEENQRVIMNVLGQEITSEDAVRTTMQAAGLTAMLAGPMAGIVIALGGLAVVAGTRLQEWIESKRVEAVDAIESELDARLEAGTFADTAGQATLGSTVANALGLNIQDESRQSVDALVTRGNSLLAQLRRNQQAAAGELNEFSGMEGSQADVFGTGAVDLSSLDEAARQEVEELGATLDRAFDQQRGEMSNYSKQSLRNMRLFAEYLGRNEIVSYIDELLNRPVVRDRRDAAPTLSIADLEGLTIPEVTPSTPSQPGIPVLPPESLLQRAIDLEQLTADTEAFLRAATGGVQAPIVVNNVDNSSSTSGSATIRYDNSMSPYDRDAYIRRGLVPQEIR